MKMRRSYPRSSRSIQWITLWDWARLRSHSNTIWRTTYPITLVFDKSGKLVHRFDKLLSENDLRAAVEKAL